MSLPVLLFQGICKEIEGYNVQPNPTFTHRSLVHYLDAVLLHTKLSPAEPSLSFGGRMISQNCLNPWSAEVGKIQSWKFSIIYGSERDSQGLCYFPSFSALWIKHASEQKGLEGPLIYLSTIIKLC